MFYYDLGSPEAYLAAERVNDVLPVVPVWQPVLARELSGSGATGGPALDRDGIERRAAAHGLQPFRWPARWPPETETAMLAAVFAQQSGRVVAYSLAAFRQAFAAGRDLGVTDNVLIAAAACELHPRAVLKGIASRSVKERLRAATASAARAGVRTVPTVSVGDTLFEGEARLDQAAARLCDPRRPVESSQ